MNIIAPLAWTAIASLEPNNAGKVSLEQLGFKAPQAQQGTSKIMLTQGTGKLAVNVSKAAKTSVFVKALNIIMQGAKVAAPLVTLPAISVPALSAFTEVLSYWEDRTRFIMAGNLTTVVATQQALSRSGSGRPVHRLGFRRLPDGSAEAHGRTGQGVAEFGHDAGLPGAEGCRSESAAPDSRAECTSRDHVCVDARERHAAGFVGVGQVRGQRHFIRQRQFGRFKEERFGEKRGQQEACEQQTELTGRCGSVIEQLNECEQQAFQT